MNYRNSPDQFANVIISFDPRREGITLPPGSKVHLMSSHSSTPWQVDPTFRMDVRNGVFTYDGELPTGELEYKFYVEPMGGTPYWFPEDGNMRMTVSNSLQDQMATYRPFGSDYYRQMDALRDVHDQMDAMPRLDLQASLDAAMQMSRQMAVDINASMERKKIDDVAIQYLLYADLADTTIQVPLFGQKVAPRRPELPSPQISAIRQKVDALRSQRIALSPNEQHYAEALSELFRQYGGTQAVVQLANTVQSRFKDLASVLKLSTHLSPYSFSASWAYWDIAKQYYLIKHPQESTSEYNLGNPMSDTQISFDIIHRHLGWELYRQWNNNPMSQKDVESAMLKLSPSDKRDAALRLLNTPAKANGTLRSVDLAKLGSLFNYWQ